MADLATSTVSDGRGCIVLCSAGEPLGRIVTAPSPAGPRVHRAVDPFSWRIHSWCNRRRVMMPRRLDSHALFAKYSREVSGSVLILCIALQGPLRLSGHGCFPSARRLVSTPASASSVNSLPSAAMPMQKLYSSQRSYVTGMALGSKLTTAEVVEQLALLDQGGELDLVDESQLLELRELLQLRDEADLLVEAEPGDALEVEQPVEAHEVDEVARDVDDGFLLAPAAVASAVPAVDQVVRDLLIRLAAPVATFTFPAAAFTFPASAFTLTASTFALAAFFGLALLGSGILGSGILGSRVLSSGLLGSRVLSNGFLGGGLLSNGFLDGGHLSGGLLSSRVLSGGLLLIRDSNLALLARHLGAVARSLSNDQAARLSRGVGDAERRHQANGEKKNGGRLHFGYLKRKVKEKDCAALVATSSHEPVDTHSSSVGKDGLEKRRQKEHSWSLVSHRPSAFWR